MHLDSQTLQQLQQALAEIRASPQDALPRGTIARLAAVLPEGMGLSIDFDSAEVLGHPLVVLRPSAAPNPCFATLSPREKEIAGLLATGLRNRDIAMALEIKVSTVKDHVHRILSKSGLDSRAAVAALWRAP